MKRKIMLIICILFLILGTSCTSKEVTEENNQNNIKIQQLENTIASLENEIDIYEENQQSFVEKRDYYLAFIQSLTDRFSEEEQITIAQSQWNYHLLLDENPIPDDGIIEVYEDEFQLSVIEEQNQYVVLPNDLHLKGKISGSIFSNHIKFLNSKPNETTGEDGTLISSTTYNFNNLSTDTIINLEISAEFQQRLGLSTNIVTIKIVDAFKKNTSDSNLKE